LIDSIAITDRESNGPTVLGLSRCDY
jgi:hypothetical protein